MNLRLFPTYLPLVFGLLWQASSIWILVFGFPANPSKEATGAEKCSLFISGPIFLFAGFALTKSYLQEGKEDKS